MKIHLILAAALFAAGFHSCESKPPAPEGSSPAQRQRLSWFPQSGVYTGAYLDLGDTEDDLSLEKIEKFEDMTGKHLAVIACSSWWGEQSFPTRQLGIIAAHDAIPIVYWSPWDKPYDENRGPDRFSLRKILAGQWDKYIDDWARQARDFGHPLFVAWGLEMNGTWFPWSGTFYGGGKRIAKDPDRWEGPELYKRAYRYVVDRVRAQGASNILWVFHTNNYSYPSDEWNLAAAYYPGDKYVDWLGMSVYGKQFNKDPWCDFADLLDYPYEEIGSLSPNKPIMLAEWGVGEFPSEGDKGKYIREAMERMSTKYPRLKAAVFWHERWENSDGSFSNLRVNSSPGALEAYKKGVANPFWLDKPQYK